MDHCKMKVTKEWYETYMRQGKTLTPEQKRTLFGDSIVYGYGLYGYHMEKNEDGYVCHYDCGESCD